MASQREEVKVVVDQRPTSFTHPEQPIIDGAPDLSVAPIANLKGISPEERAKLKSYFVTQLERGVIHDRLKVDLPPHLHGEWVRRDPIEVEAMKAYGFVVDDKYSVGRSTNSDGTKTGQVADVVFMVCPREVKDLIDEVKHERFVNAHAKKGSNTAKEERDYATQVRAHGDIIPMVDSKSREVTKDEVAATLAAINAQTP